MQKALNQKLFYPTSLRRMESSACAQESLLQELKNKPGDRQAWSEAENETIAALCQGIKQSHADLKEQIQKHRQDWEERHHLEKWNGDRATGTSGAAARWVAG